MHGLVRLSGQAGEDVGEIRFGIDAFAVAVADECVERGGACAASRVAHEQPVLFADGAGTDGVFDEVVVDLHAPVSHIHGEFVPLVESVADGGSGEASRSMSMTALQFVELCFDAG